MSKAVSSSKAASDSERPWYSGITGYQWTVLVIASLGWIFDVFEGQVFVASMNEAIPSLLPDDAPEGRASLYNNLAFGSFLLGGALGGVVFGVISDRIGRSRTMIITILMYACFTGVTAFVQSPWQMVAMRFFVAMGVGGEWAVASALVAEVMPERARARLLGVFHASSVLGAYLAVGTGQFIVGNTALQTEAYPDLNWRLAFVVGALPALLTIWIRLKLRESSHWLEARNLAQKDPAKKTGRIGELFSEGLVRRTVIGVALATVGLATMWGVHIYGKDLARNAMERHYIQSLSQGEQAPEEEQKAILEKHFESIKGAEMLGMLLTTTGGGLGLLLFGPICERIGRRGAFVFYHIGGLAIALFLFQAIPHSDITIFWFLLPVFGFLTLGMHAGYAIYFPELFPTRLRGTGGGFCFNVGRVLAAPILFIGGWMQSDWGYSLEQSVSLLSLLYLLGIVIVLFAPETKGRALPE